MHTDDGYFDGSRRTGDLLALVDGMEAFGVDQVALRLNRPDVIYRRIEADRADLARTTIALDEMEALVGGVKARRRLLLLDACQSGDLDPEALSSIRARAEANGLSVRVTAGSDAGDARPRTYLAARDRSVYARLERRTGAVVFASSMGDEVSVESASLGSGVFTGAILRALSTPAADANRDGWITIDELEPAVKILVGEATHGLQHPNIDRENSLQTLRLPLLP